MSATEASIGLLLTTVNQHKLTSVIWYTSFIHIVFFPPFIFPILLLCIKRSSCIYYDHKYVTYCHCDSNRKYWFTQSCARASVFVPFLSQLHYATQYKCVHIAVCNIWIPKVFYVIIKRFVVASIKSVYTTEIFKLIKIAIFNKTSRPHCKRTPL